MSETEFKVGDRVRVTNYAGFTDNHYVGLTGEVATIGDGGVTYHRVILDNDPNPSLRERGLPVDDDEIEKIEAGS